jgi:hypothetical protein
VATNKSDWAGDTSPSLPEANTKRIFVHFGGFVFTDGGMAHDISSDDVSRLRVPPYAPPDIKR